MTETALYHYFDAGDRPLYIGITDNLDGRERGHFRSSCWMPFVARSTVVRYPDRDAALEAERQAIETEHPLFNRQYNNTAGARDRQKAYLEEIGRMDLYKKWILWRPPPMGELEMREARRKREAVRLVPEPPASPALPELEEPEVTMATAHAVVILTVQDYGSNEAQIYLNADEATAIADALYRHAVHARRRGSDWATTSLEWRDGQLCA